MDPVRDRLIDGIGDRQHFDIVARDDRNQLQLRPNQPLHHGRVFAIQLKNGVVIPSLVDLKQILLELERGQLDLGGSERLLLGHQHQRHQHRQARQQEEPARIESKKRSRRSHLE